MADAVSMSACILVVDADPRLRRFLKVSLAANGYRVVEAETGAQGRMQALQHPLDAILLDLDLPDGDGQELISTLRQLSDAPIIVVSGRSDELDKVQALDRGAQDYVVKPFGVAELLARLRAALRPASDRPDPIERGGLRIDFTRRRAQKDGAELRLGKREWQLLAYMARHRDQLLPHGRILRDVWGAARADDAAYLRAIVHRLRKKLENDPERPDVIVSEAGLGYRLKLGG